MSSSAEPVKLKILAALQSNSEALISLLADHETHQLPPDEIDIRHIEQAGYNIILLEDGADALPALRAADPRVEIILFGESDKDALDAVGKGATAYFKTPPDLGLLAHTIEGIIEVCAVRRETAKLEKILQEKYTFKGVVAKNPLMLDIFTYMRRIAPHYRTVTITGETGTGKEVLARALHSLSPKAESPFVACNCGAFVEGLIESELFGHRKGAFTGAIADGTGFFEAAGDGTLLLDEIGLLPLSFQPHLLRVLQDGEFRRVGSSQPAKARCRVIAATNKDLAAEVRAGTFREDLFYRLNSLSIHLPPLRERKEDIPLLCRHLLDKFGRRTGKKIFGMSRPAQAAMISYDWPGNVRELESIIEQAAILATGSFIDVCVLPTALRESPRKGNHFLPVTLNYMVRKHLETVLINCSGNKTQAAKILGISRRALQRKLEKQTSL